MKRSFSTSVLQVALALSFAGITIFNPVIAEEINMTASTKTQVSALLKSIETGDAKPVAFINANK